MSDSGMNSPAASLNQATVASCDHGVSCCDGDSSATTQSDHADGIHGGHDHDHDHRIDGAGEPCPTPLMWQEICANYYRDSLPWEITRGPHQITGRTWGEGTPVYFLNNFAATAELYSLIAWLLRENFRCILFDATTRDSRAARQDWPTMSDFAADLFAVADAQGDRVFDVFGAGFGAAVAIQAAIQRPDRIKSLILQHAFARRQLTLFERTLAQFCLRSNLSLDRLPQRKRFQAVNHQPWFPPFDSSRFEFLLESTGNLPLRDLARRAVAIHSFNVTERLKEIRCPVMMLRTEGEGRLAAESQAVIEKELHSPQVEWMHSAGQHPCLTHPHRVAKLLRAWFQNRSEPQTTLAQGSI